MSSLRSNESRRRFDAEEKAAFEAKIAPHLAAYNKTLIKLAQARREAVHQFWSMPILKIQKMGAKILKTPLAIDEGIALEETATRNQTTEENALAQWWETVETRT